MIQAVSCGGVVIYRRKILLLYKNYHNHYDGWVLPKGTVEEGETFEETALREVREESGVKASIISYIGDSHYSFQTAHSQIEKTVHWYLMEADSFYCHPQKSEFFQDAGFYKYHEACHLLKYANEREILEKGFHSEKL